MNNRNSEGGYHYTEKTGYTYNGNQNRGNYNGSRQNNPYANRNLNRGSGLPHGVNQPQRQRRRPERRSALPRTSQPSVKPPMRFVPIFAALLILMISVGIFFTVMNSRSRTASTIGSDDSTQESEYNTSADIGEDISSSFTNIKVPYASVTSSTKELGSSITSDYGILINLSTNTVTAQKNPDSTIFPASMTKIMTLIVAYENCKNFNDKFTMTSDITDPLFIAGASVAGFSVGEQITIRDLLYGAILPSGGDATDALAIYTAGSIEAFVDMMNKKALKMGLSDTHFANPSGLHDDDHYSTPHEMALILQYALQIKECREILSTYQYTTAKTPEHPEGLLLTSTMFSRMKGDESGVATILGGKTGFTNEGLHCLASFARVGNDEYVLVTAHAPGTYDPVYDCINIYKNYFGE
ncbi:MAG: serine hydrolase [Clostridia bacterium]|nr:serine hydrolase [Clostridia bacterium]